MHNPMLFRTVDGLKRPTTGRSIQGRVFRPIGKFTSQITKQHHAILFLIFVSRCPTPKDKIKVMRKYIIVMVIQISNVR